jgi:peroxiredoxin
VDGVWCHTAFGRNRKLHFPLLADFEAKFVARWWLFWARLRSDCRPS